MAENEQNKDYKEKILEIDSCKRIIIEAGSMKGWGKYLKEKDVTLGVENFGKSAPYKQVYNHFDLTSDKVVEFARKLLKE